MRVNASPEPRWAVFLSAAGIDQYEAKRIASKLYPYGATVFLDETHSVDTDSEALVLTALNAADEVLVLLTPTHSLDRRFLWLAVGAASGRGLPLIGVSHGIKKADVESDNDLPAFIKHGELVNFSVEKEWQTYCKELQQRIQNSPRCRGMFPEWESGEWLLRSNNRFDVCLCYNVKDKEEIDKIAKELKKRRILPWGYEWHRSPTMGNWQSNSSIDGKEFISIVVFSSQQNSIADDDNTKFKQFLQQHEKSNLIGVNLQSHEPIPQPSYLLEKDILRLDLHTLESEIDPLVWKIIGYDYDPPVEITERPTPRPKPAAITDEEKNEIVAILETHSDFDDINARKSTLATAGLGKLLPRLDLVGSSHDFSKRVIVAWQEIDTFSAQSDQCPIGKLLHYFCTLADFPPTHRTTFERIIAKYHLMPPAHNKSQPEEP